MSKATNTASRWTPFALSAPSLALFALMVLLPLALTALLSFQQYDQDRGVQSGFTLAPNTYTVCEIGLAVSWAATATLDGNPLTGASFFNPDAGGGQDLGTRCASIVLAYGDDRTLVVTNNPPPTPGGNARTIGYWKNWSSCAQSSGKQYDKAKQRGDWSKTLDGNLPEQIGDLFLAGASVTGGLATIVGKLA